jgi:hypothetical protein
VKLAEVLLESRFDELVKFLGPRAKMSMKTFNFLHKVDKLMSDKQMEAARKMSKYGWHLYQIVWNHSQTKAALGFRSKDIGGWVMPDGELIRPKTGKTRAYLPAGWDKEVDLSEETVDPSFQRMMKKIVKTPSDGPTTIMAATGSDEYNAITKLGVKFIEKPESWSEVDKHPITESTLEKCEEAIGTPFKIYTQDKIFFGKRSTDPKSKDGYWPLSNAHLPREPMFIVHMKDRSRYLVESTQAKNYIRLWVRIR